MWNDNEIHNESENSGGFMMDTTLSGEKSSGPKRIQNCVPLMIAHLDREDIEVWGISVRLVTFVAILRKYENVSTKVTFEFEDETGTIKGVKWLDSSLFQCPVKLNSYARVYGSIRHQNNETFVLVSDVKPMEHLNELLTHLLEVTYVCLEGEKKINLISSGDKNFLNNSLTNGNNVIGDTKSVPSSYHSGLTNDHSLILNVIRDNGTTEVGVERSDIMRKIPSYLVSKATEILDFLASEGHIYTTKTDDYFKVI